MTESSNFWRSRNTEERTLLVLGLACLLGFSLWLWPFWTSLPELSHAFLAPVFCALLLLRSQREKSFVPGKWLRSGLLLASGGLWLFLSYLCALLILSRGLLHSRPVFVGIAGFMLLLFMAVLVLDRGPRPLLRLNGASLCGIGLWLFAIPMPPGPPERLTFLLRDLTSEVVLRSLVWLGIPAQRQGNILSFSSHLVGVEEACSGIRSLLACLFCATLLAGYFVKGTWRRIFLLLFGAILALVGNYARSLALCLMVHRDVEISGFWHDATAYIVLFASVALLFAVALFLGKQPQEKPRNDYDDTKLSVWPSRLVLSLFGLCSTAFLVVLVAMQVTKPKEIPTPDLRQLLSLEVPGWRRRENTEVRNFVDTLQTDKVYEFNYRRGSIEVNFYMAFWPAGKITLASVGLHRPDICLPLSGWTETNPPPAKGAYPIIPVQRYSYAYQGATYHMWFWHFSGGEIVDPFRVGERSEVRNFILKHPLSARVPQWVIRVSSNVPLEDLAQGPLLTAFFERLKQQGLVGETTPTLRQ